MKTRLAVQKLAFWCIFVECSAPDGMEHLARLLSRDIDEIRKLPSVSVGNLSLLLLVESAYQLARIETDAKLRVVQATEWAGKASIDSAYGRLASAVKSGQIKVALGSRLFREDNSVEYLFGNHEILANGISLSVEDTYF